VGEDDVVGFAHRMFDLARSGGSSLAGYVDAGVPVGLTDAAGNTLLMLAAYHGHAELVHALLRRGADANIANDRGQTPLAGAVFKGELDVVRALVAGGADPAAGTPSALAAAQLFERADLLAILRGDA